MSEFALKTPEVTRVYFKSTFLFNTFFVKLGVVKFDKI